MTSNRASLGTRITAALCAALLIPSSVVSSPLPYPQTATQTTTAKIPNDQLDSLVAPIALYPDPLLAQTLAASTYPLEIIQLQQWMAKHPDLKGEALAAAVEKENWDPAVQGLAGLPDVVKRLADDIKWTTDLGNAFLAQQSDVMDAVQRMRKKASDAGNLKTTEQQKVTTQVVQTQEVIVIQQANPQVIYVPAYNPVVVYGPPIYPYPPIYYPPVGYYAAGVAIGFGVGVAMGAFWGGGWGYGPRWGYGSVHINVNNRYVNHYNRYNSYNRYGRQLESQSAASRRNAVRGSQHREPLWRHGAGRFDGDATGAGPAERWRVCADTARHRGQSERERRCESCRRVARHEQRGRESRYGERGQRRPRRQSQHPEQPGFLEPKRQRLRRRLEQPPEQQRRPQQQPARVGQRGRVARTLRRRRATEVTAMTNPQNDLTRPHDRWRRDASP